jgi:hypothetical protein
MKRTLSFISLFASMAATMAQCVPNSGFTGSGVAFLPSEPIQVYSCAECGDQEVVISLQTFADTVLTIELQPGNPLDITVFADQFRLDTIEGLPAGLTYTTDAAFNSTYDPVEFPFGYWPNGGDTVVGFTEALGCITVSGDAASWTAAIGGGPNNDGIYPLTIFLDARAAGFIPAELTNYVAPGTWLAEMGVLLEAFGDTNFTTNGIRYEGETLEVIASGVGIQNRNESSIRVDVFPNPSNGTVTFAIQAARSESGTIQLMNSLGEVVRTVKMNLQSGENRTSLDLTTLAKGHYAYRLIGADSVLSGTVVIN